MSAKKKIWNILMVGVGGQGIVLASDIVAQAALFSGYNVKKSEIPRMSQQGCSVFRHIRFGLKVHSAIIPEASCDILLSLDLLETLRWVAYTNSKTKVIVLEESILPTGLNEYPSGIKEELEELYPNKIFLDPILLEDRIKDKRFINITLCGYLSSFLAFKLEAWHKACKHCISAEYLSSNWDAFLAGRNLPCKF